MEYRVQFFQDNIYEVYGYEDDEFHSYYQGSLSDCEAWIRLKESGRL